MEKSNRAALPKWLRAALCVALSLALCAAFALPPASAVSGAFTGTAWASADDDDPDEPDGGDDGGGTVAGCEGAEVESAERAAGVTATLTGSKIAKTAEYGSKAKGKTRYAYTHGTFTELIAESAGDNTKSSVSKSNGNADTNGRTVQFKCANYVKVTFGCAIEELATRSENEGMTIARYKGKKVRTIGSGGEDVLENFIAPGKTGLVWIEKQEVVGDRAGDADAPKVQFTNKTQTVKVYGDYEGGKGSKTVNAIEMELQMNLKAQENSNTILNKVALTYVNKAADQVFWKTGTDRGPNEDENNSNGKLYQKCRLAHYVDDGSGTDAYSEYTAYSFAHGASGASECKARNVDFNVTINLGSTGAIASTHTATATGKADHYDRVTNRWGYIKLKQPKEKVKVDLGGGSIEGLDASSAPANKLFDNYTLGGKVSEVEAGTKKGAGITLANGTTITLGVPKKEGAKFLGWAWKKTDKNFDSAYSESGQNRADYADSKFRAASATKIASGTDQVKKDNATLKNHAKDLSTISGTAANGDGKAKAEIYGSKTATIKVENGFQTFKREKANADHHDNGWVKTVSIMSACTTYRAVWSDEDPTLDNTHTLTYNVGGVDKLTVSGIKAGASVTLKSLSELGAKDGW